MRTSLERWALERLAARLAPLPPPQPPGPITSEWQLALTFTKAIEAGAREANQLTTSSLLNLLNFDRPTIMQEWRLRSIAVPVAVKFTQAAGEHLNAVVVITATLRYGGDPVWETAGVTERGSTVHNLVLSDRLEPAIVVRTGRTLTLEISARCYEAVTALEVLLAGRYSTTAGVLAAEPADGRLTYQAVNHSGRRIL